MRNMFKFLLPFFLLLGSLSSIGQTLYYGQLRAIQIMNYDDTILSSTNYYGMSFLYNYGSLTTLFSPHNSKENGTVMLNNSPLYFEPRVLAYLDTTKRTSLKGINWAIGGSDSIPAFNYSCKSSFPTFGGITSLPDTISKSTDLLIPVVNLLGADQIEFTLDDFQSHDQIPWYRKIDAGITSFSIPSSQLANLGGQVAQVITLRITFIKSEIAIINNKSFKFENRLSVFRNVTLTN